MHEVLLSLQTLNRNKLLQAALVLAGVGAVALFGALLPTVESSGIVGFSGQRGVQLLGLALFASVWLVLFNIKSDSAIYLGLLAVPLLIGQTGMQLDIGQVRTSALEALILGLTLSTAVALIAQRQLRLRLPTLSRPLLFLMLFLLSLGLGLAFVRGVPAFAVITMVKGYYLYPFLLLVALVVVQSRRQLALYIVLGLISALYAGLTVAQYTTYDVALVGGALIDRLSGVFGIINQFGFYLASMAILGTALFFHHPHPLLRLCALAVAIVCVSAMLSTLSRGAAVGLLAGMGALGLLTDGRRRTELLVLALLLVLIQPLIPEWVPLRFNYTSLGDHSTSLRLYYLQTGWQAIQHYPLGAGWGASFWLTQANSLIPANGLPWSHNDYLNLTVQVGLLGLGVFLGCWWSLYRYVWRALRTLAVAAELRAYMIGGMAATFGLFVSGATDHILQRQDIAGQLWWMASIMLCAARLAYREAADQHSTAEPNATRH